MPDEAAERINKPAQAPGSLSLSGEDKRLLAALLDELLGKTKDGPQPQGPAPTE